MEKITIKIPTGLTPEDELIMISKELGRKYLPSGSRKTTKMIGSGYSIEKLQTNIEIIREPVEKPIVTFVCPVCETIFEKQFSKILYTNYGGKTRQKRCCSDDCRDFYIGINPARISKTKSGLRPVYQR